GRHELARLRGRHLPFRRALWPTSPDFDADHDRAMADGGAASARQPTRLRQTGHDLRRAPAPLAGRPRSRHRRDLPPLEAEQPDRFVEMRAADRRGEIQELRRDMAAIHQAVALISLNSLALLRRGRTRVVEDEIDRLRRHLTGMLHLPPQPQIVLDRNDLSGLGPARAI